MAIKPEKTKNARRQKDRKDWGGITEPGKNPGKRTKKPGEHEKKTGRETEPGENFGPSTSSTSCFYHPCLRLERRRLDREELRKTKAQRQRE